MKRISIIMSKAIALGIFVLFIGASVVTSVAGDKTVFTKGNMLYVGGGGPGNYTSIQDAIDDANKGDTVFVFDDSSPYKENLVIDKSISLIGENKDSTVIDGDLKDHVVQITASWVNISGFTIKNSKTQLPTSSGIWIFSTSKIYENCTITDSLIIDCNTGIAVAGKNNLISENTIKNNGYFGVYVFGSFKYNTIIKNEISNNGKTGIGLNNGPRHNEVTDNVISNNAENGIWLYDASWNYIAGNEVNDNNKIGILIERSSNGNTIYENEIENNNRMGMFLVTLDFIYPKNNFIYNNAFIGNKLNAKDEGTNIWNDDYPIGGNYWDDHDGTDRYGGPNQDIPGADSIADTSYDIPGGDNIDYYPIVRLVADAGGPYVGLINEPMEFIGYAANGYPPYTWHWDFGDGNESNEQNTTHTYTRAARDSHGNYCEYTVTLTVTDNEGNITNATSPVKINLPVEIQLIRGGLGLTVRTQNTGIVTIRNVNWSIEMEGLVMPTEHYGVISLYDVGTETLKTGLLLGIGRVRITVTAGTETKIVLAYVVGPFIFGVEAW